MALANIVGGSAGAILAAITAPTTEENGGPSAEIDEGMTKLPTPEGPTVTGGPRKFSLRGQTLEALTPKAIVTSKTIVNFALLRLQLISDHQSAS